MFLLALEPVDTMAVSGAVSPQDLKTQFLTSPLVQSVQNVSTTYGKHLYMYLPVNLIVAGFALAGSCHLHCSTPSPATQLYSVFLH